MDQERDLRRSLYGRLFLLACCVQPFAERYQQTDKKLGVAADAAAGDKERRYGAEVWVLNFESRGRLGTQGIALLQHLAAEANCWSAIAQRRLASFWRTRLERALVHSQAESMLLCLGAQLECINTHARMGAAKSAASSAAVADEEVVGRIVAADTMPTPPGAADPTAPPVVDPRSFVQPSG